MTEDHEAVSSGMAPTSCSVCNVAGELLDVGGDRVVAVQHVTGRARQSGIETELRYAAVYTLRERRIIRIREYSDREHAPSKQSDWRTEAMSQEDVDLVRRAMRAFNDRDFPALESIYSEDSVLRLIGGFADLTGSEFRGRDAFLDWIREWIETIGPRGEIETIRQVNDQVLAIVNFAATGAASGVDTTLRTGQVYWFRDGRISALDGYYTVDGALKAVGLI